ncbi:MAG: hypothetical protein O0W93_00790, partial [Methanocorpusculum sp.]|nr:hypothetical protein [Methanocorpusculum sp.]
MLCGCLLAVAARRDLRVQSVPIFWWVPGIILAVLALWHNPEHIWAFSCIAIAVFAGCLLRLYAGADMRALLVRIGVLIG